MAITTSPQAHSTETPERADGSQHADVFVAFGITGDLAKVMTFRSLEQTWRVLQPLLDAPPPLQPYEPGTWGPAAADALVAGRDGWFGPWIAS